MIIVATKTERLRERTKDQAAFRTVDKHATCASLAIPSSGWEVLRSLWHHYSAAFMNHWA